MPAKLTRKEAEQLITDAAREQDARRDFALPVYMDITTALQVVANLQLALRQSRNIGPSAQTARQVIDAIITRMEQEGFTATARVARLGDNPAYDI